MTVHFCIKRSGWGYDDIYKALKTGEKTSEWRLASQFWISRLFKKGAQASIRHNFLRHPGPKLFTHPDDHKHTDARFVVGRTKYPRLIAEIHNIYYHRAEGTPGDLGSEDAQFEIQIKNIREELGP